MLSAEGAVALVQATERHNEAALLGAAGPPRDWLNPSKSLVDHALDRYPSPSAGCRAARAGCGALLNPLSFRWSNTRMRADNTSVVTLMLDPPGPPRATVLRSRTGAAQRPHAAAPAAPPAHPPPAAAAPAAPPAAHAATPSGDGESRHVPQNGLTIMTRYSEVDKPASTPEAADKTPLPPCATLDGRFSIPGREDSPRDNVEDSITNYGNPAESYFMARLLNRSRVVNTLSEVYDEIANRPTSRAPSETPEAPPATALLDSAADGAAPVPPDRRDAASGDMPSALTPPAASAPSAAPASPSRPEPDGGIQINEVSSSSPTDAPRPRGRKPRGDARRDVVPNDRVLRSHPHHEPDAPGRPHTRQTRGKNVERVVILTRRPPPKPERAERSPAGRRAPDCAEEEARRTRSQLASGNCARAPGPARRAAAARGAHYKENLCGRTRARTAPAPRLRARRAPSDEVHSTTGWARALRSRNDGEPHPSPAAAPAAAPTAPATPAAPPAKRARCEQAAPPPGASKRAGPWPTLALRNRLRRRLAK